MKHNRFRFPLPERQAVLVLLTELPVILLFAVVLLVSCLCDAAVDPLGAAYYYAELLPYIAVSLLISTATALVTDLLVREAKAQRK